MRKSHDDWCAHSRTGIRVRWNGLADLPDWDGGKFRLSTKPELCLAGFMPTQAVFTKMTVISNFRWCEPDVVVEVNGWRYVADVCDNNDTFSGTARKIEAIIAAAPKDRLVGFAIVDKEGDRKPYRGQQQELDVLRATFWRVLGQDPSGDADDEGTYLRALMEAPNVEAVYGRVDWACIQTFSVAEDGWAEKLRCHARKALAQKRSVAVRDDG
jgi:hypothetical protein